MISSGMRTLLIGDIHGHLVALEALLDAVGPTSSDRMIFLGDYVNGGPESAGVIERLIGLQRAFGAVCLRGNHDDAFDRALKSPDGAIGFLAMGGVSAVQSYGGKSLTGVPREHAEFLEGLPLSWHDSGLICVHGRIGREDRAEAPDRGLALWGRVGDAEAHESGRLVVCGHTRQRSGVPWDGGHTVCIDTGVKGGGWLTCLEAGAWGYVQADERGRTRRGSLR